MLTYFQRLFAVALFVRVTFKQPFTVTIGKTETLDIINVIYYYCTLIGLVAHTPHRLLSV